MKLCMGVMLTLTLAGCAAVSGYPTNYQDEALILKADAPYLAADVRAKGDDPSDSVRGGLSQQQYRDTVVYRRIEVIDNYYYDFESTLTGTYNGIDVSADLAALTLNGLGAVVGAKGTKAALAAASAGVLGSKTAINTDIFYQKTLPTLITQMRASRLQILAKIESGLGNPVTKYSIDQALNDINAYYLAGTLPGAVAQITAQAGATASTATANIDALRTSKYAAPTTTGERLIKWLYPKGVEGGTPDSTKLAALQNWMNGYSADSRLGQIPFILLLHDPALEADRARAIVDLSIP